MIIRSEEEFSQLKRSGQILGEALGRLKNEARAGVLLKHLDDLARELILKAGAEPAFLNYHPYGARRPFPASVCLSVNEGIVHGHPDDYILKEGDILKIDLGVKYQGYFTDAALTVGIGKISPLARELIETTRTALDTGIREAVAGRTLGDIGSAVEKTVKSAGFKVAAGLTGHGIGLKLHEKPDVYNYGYPGQGLKLKKGMVLAIEPIVTAGNGRIKQLTDDSFATADGSLAAHFEQTVVVSEKEPAILTPI